MDINLIPFIKQCSFKFERGTLKWRQRRATPLLRSLANPIGMMFNRYLLRLKTYE